MLIMSESESKNTIASIDSGGTSLGLSNENGQLRVRSPERRIRREEIVPLSQQRERHLPESLGSLCVGTEVDSEFFQDF